MTARQVAGTQTKADLPAHTGDFITELDTAVEAHMEWTRRILRCVLLQSPPDEDMYDPDAHTLCHFGGWFRANRNHFDLLDAPSAARVHTSHQTMHDAIRSICGNVQAGRTEKEASLAAFEQSQSELIGLLAHFKTLILSAATRRDPLTQLPLRYGIESDFILFQKEARRNRTLLYLAIIDIDHFKRVNDTWGHPTGDRVLRHLADTLKRSLRDNEPLYRYGGEEFLWLLKCKSATEARQSARRVLAIVGTTPVPINDNEILRLTVTMGLARVGEQDDLESAIQRADQALYEGKNNGRNRYVIA
ncbi:MAG: diguanylate cyclase [Thiobacillus sp. 63-78]|uniref:diguanylate cyclase n=1 Tax=Thiobacillus sp. 63-78 TaxID=1895859 RepID=UPI00095D9258|nr:diguanylate cyclase [Thiobacillus sp. 63-78]OJZ05814.1 MAG: diguanylate cyclase [Thiobacillus sp. 63-78]